MAHDDGARMDDFDDRSTDHGAERTTTAEQRAAERACDDLLRRIEAVATRALGAARHERMDDDASLAALVNEYAGCARAAGMRPEQMVGPLKVAMGRFY